MEPPFWILLLAPRLMPYRCLAQLVDADHFWKYTHNAYDFSTLLNTTITFPISWHSSKLDGVTGRVSATNMHGFQAYWTFGHTRADISRRKWAA